MKNSVLGAFQVESPLMLYFVALNNNKNDELRHAML